MNVAESSDFLLRLNEQMREAAAFASTLVGLPYAFAEERAAQRGFRAVRLTLEEAVVTADLDVRRIRLFVDGDN